MKLHNKSHIRTNQHTVYLNFTAQYGNLRLFKHIECSDHLIDSIPQIAQTNVVLHVIACR